MADSNSVTAALATLQAAGWNVTPNNTYQGAGVLNASQAAWVQSSASGGGLASLETAPNTLYMIGDSLCARNWSTTDANFISTNHDGVFEVANEIRGYPFNIVANLGVGGKTAAQVLTEQLPTVLAAQPKYCYVQCGVNDLYVSTRTGAATAADIISIVTQLANAGIIPIWSTVWARAFTTSGVLSEHQKCNDLLKQFWFSTKTGIFWDGYGISVDPVGSNSAPRTGWMPNDNIHPNNVGGHWLGKSLAPLLPLGPGLLTSPFEDSTTSGGSNLLANPQFTGTGGTAGANMSGTVPTSWTVDWATRTGTGTAVAAIVDITDTATGLVTARAIEVTINSGAPASGDVLRITQASGINSSLVLGDLMSGECMLQLASPSAVTVVAMRTQTNSTESTWWGQITGGVTVGAFPEGWTRFARTRKLAVGGTAQTTPTNAARFDVRMTFGAAASTGTVLRMWLPRFRKG